MTVPDLTHPATRVAPTARAALTSGARARRLGFVAAAALPLAAFGVFFAYPVASLLVRGFASRGSLDLGSFGDVLSRPRFARILAFTVGQAAAR